jgi:hypothetical protein
MRDSGLVIQCPIVTVVTIQPIFRFAPQLATTMPSAPTPQHRICCIARLLAMAVGTTVLGGCYDGDALVKQAQSTALNSSMAEVDLGKYRTTLPRDPNTGRYYELEMHIFGTVPRSRLSEAKKLIKGEEFRVRQETLTAVRQSTREELSDPTLAELRARIEQVVNKVLAEAPLKEIGFYQLTVR